MPKLVSETISTGDQSWLGSAHAIRDCRTETLLASAWTSVATNGVVPSGYPAALVSGLLVPYDKTEGTTTGAGVLAGHIFVDVNVSIAGKQGVPLLDHGRVKAAKVPLASPPFVRPAAAAKSVNLDIVYI